MLSLTTCDAVGHICHIWYVLTIAKLTLDSWRSEYSWHEGRLSEAFTGLRNRHVLREHILEGDKTKLLTHFHFNDLFLDKDGGDWLSGHKGLQGRHYCQVRSWLQFCRPHFHQVQGPAPRRKHRGVEKDFGRAQSWWNLAFSSEIQCW